MRRMITMLGTFVTDHNGRMKRRKAETVTKSYW